MKAATALILLFFLTSAPIDAQEVSLHVRVDAADFQHIAEVRPDQLTLHLTEESDPAVLHRHAALTPDARIVVGGGHTQPTVAADDLLLYRGRIGGESGSRVVFGVSRGAGFGVVVDKSSAITSFTTGMLDATQPAVASSVGSEAARCGVEYEDAARKSADAFFDADVGDLFADLLEYGPIDTIEVPVAVEADFETYEAFGRSVEATATYLLTVISAVSAVYEEELGIRLVVPFVHVWDSPDDPYGGSSLANVRLQLASHFQAEHADIERALGHLISVRRFDDWTGIARFAGLCNDADGFSAVRGDPDDLASIVRDTAHEIGHLFGAHHTHSCAWPGGPLDFCRPVEGSCYAGPPLQVEGTIMSYCNQTRLTFHRTVKRLLRSRAEKAVQSSCAAFSYTVPFAARDSLALAELYLKTGGEAWRTNAGWLREPIRMWSGIRSSSGKVLSIDLSGRGLHGRLPESPGGMEWLLSLDLSDNEIEGPLPIGWTGFPRLARMDLSRNAITSLPATVLDLRALQHLDLSDNAIAGPLPATWTDFPRIEHLDLARNAITSLPMSLGGLGSLRHLDLSQNRIGVLPESVGEVGSLAYLDISENRIERVPATLRRLRRLRSLGLSGLPLQNLPPQLGDLDSLRSLTARDSGIRELPDELHRLRLLEVLDLGENALATLPESFSALTGLRRLYVDHNELTRLPAGLLSLPQLIEFHAADNRLTELPDVQSPLIVVDLDNNALSRLPPFMREPRELGLANNQLSSLPFNAPWSSRLQGNHLGWHYLISSNSEPNLANRLPQTLLLPEDVVIARGHSGLLSLASQHARDTYFWSKDDGPFVTGRGNPFTIAPATGDDAGTYRACVSNALVTGSSCPGGASIPSTVARVRVFEVRANLPDSEATERGETASVDIVWLNGSRPPRFHVQVSETRSFSTLVFDDSTLTSDSLRISSLGFDAEYFVRVRALRNGWSAWSTPASTSTLPGRPPPVTAIVPEDDAADAPDFVRFAWEPGLMPDYYLLQVASTPQFDPLNFEVTATDTTYEVGPLDPGTQYWWRVAVVNASGQGEWSPVRTFTTGLPQRMVGGKPASLTLHPAYPNPFSDRTTVGFEIPRTAYVTLRVWDVLGREVETLFHGVLPGGTFRMEWVAGSHPVGTYFIEIEDGERHVVRQVTRVK